MRHLIQRKFKRNSIVTWGFALFVIPGLLLSYNNCGGSQSEDPDIFALSTSGSCSTLSDYEMSVDVPDINENFEEIDDVEVIEAISQTSCNNKVTGIQNERFTVSIRREEGILYVPTNIPRENGDFYVLQFERNQGTNFLPTVLDDFCTSDTSQVTLSGSGYYSATTNELRIDLTVNELTVSDCPREL